MKVRPLPALVAAAFVAGLTLAASAAPASALAPTAVGWWWEAEQGAPVPPPPTVPDGGFMVGADPSGANAVAALRFTLASDDSAPILTLAVVDSGGNINGSSGAVLACRPAAAWKPAAPGNWADKPVGKCDTAATGTLSSDGKTVSFALSQLVDGQTLDIVLTPAAGANFEFTFNAPSAASLATTKVANSSSSDAGASTDTAAAPDLGTSDSPSTDLSGDSTSPLFTTPFDSSATPADTQTLQITTARPTTPGSGANRAIATSSARRTPAVAVLLLLLVVGAGWAVNQVELPALRRLGPMSTAAPPAAAVPREHGELTTGGLGRFARERHGPPPKL